MVTTSTLYVHCQYLPKTEGTVAADFTVESHHLLLLFIEPGKKLIYMMHVLICRRSILRWKHSTMS